MEWVEISWPRACGSEATKTTTTHANTSKLHTPYLIINVFVFLTRS